MSSRHGSATPRSTVVIVAGFAALLALILAGWPMLSDAKGSPDAVPTESEGTSAPLADPEGSDGDAGEATPPIQEEGLEEEGQERDEDSPHMTYLDGSMEVAPDGEFGVVMEVNGAPAGSDIAVQIYDRIATVEQLEASTTDAPANLLATFDTIPLAVDDPPPSQVGSFVISLYGAGMPRPPEAGAWAYRLDEPGVYPVRVRLRGPEGEQLDSFVTYLGRTAGADESDPEPLPPTQVALLARIHQDPPDHEPNTTPATVVEQPLDPQVVAAFDRLLTTFTNRDDLPVNLAVTPDTARRLHEHPESRPSAELLRAALVDDDRALLGAPYVRVDPTDLVSNGLEPELDIQILLGHQHLGQVMGQSGDGVWLVERPLDATVVDALAARAVTALLLSPDVLVEDHHSPVVVDGTESTLVGLPLFDPGLQRTDDASAGHEVGDVLAAHQAVGRLAALQNVEEGRAAVVVTIDPDVSPDRLNSFLDRAEASPGHVQMATIDSLVPGSGSAALAALIAPNPSAEPSFADDLRSTRSRVDSYASMLEPESPNRNEFDLPLAISLGADRSAESRAVDLAQIDAVVEGRFGSISAPERDRVTLGTRDATFPLPITTASEEPLRVLIEVQASDRVELPRSRFEATLSGERTVVQIPVRTRASGDTALLITISTPDERVVLSESRYTIRSTAVSGVGVLLTIGAGGFLAVWWGRHWNRTRKDRRAEQAGARPPHVDVTSR